MQKKESFIIYKSFYGPIERMTDEQLGQLFRAIFQYQIDGADRDLQPEVHMAFQFFRNQFEVDQKKYEKVCEKRSKAASKRWDEDASASKSIQKDSKDADNDNDNVNVNAKKHDNVKEKENGLMNPFSDSFLPLWKGWLDYKKIEHKFRYKSIKSEQTAINGLYKLCNGDEEIAAKIMEQSVINGWKGFFALKKDQELSKDAKKNLGVSEDYLQRLKERING